jgi:hypothetical protein
MPGRPHWYYPVFVLSLARLAIHRRSNLGGWEPTLSRASERVSPEAGATPHRHREATAMYGKLAAVKGVSLGFPGTGACADRSVGLRKVDLLRRQPDARAGRGGLDHRTSAARRRDIYGRR